MSNYTDQIVNAGLMGTYHDLWEDAEERRRDFDSLMKRLEVCIKRRHAEEANWETVKEATADRWRHRQGELRQWIEKMEEEDLQP